jgi:hypothetical protein
MLEPSILSAGAPAQLQLGLAVELAVLPPYLYALWSIKPKTEGASAAAVEAAATIRAVVYEEMLHAALVGNVLNAILETPDLARHRMRYPAPLPGHTAKPPAGYIVSLAPLSADTAATFLRIENPDWGKPPTVDGGWRTIADLYEKVIEALRSRNEPFEPRRQLAPEANPGPGRLIEVHDLDSALSAIQIVIDQGEGHKPTVKRGPLSGDDDDHEMAHFEQFQAVAANLDQGLIDPARDIYPVIENPTAAAYSPEQQQANAEFNSLYTGLLDSLQAMFASPEPQVFGISTELMLRLSHQAAVLRSLGPVPGTNAVAGPTFEYLGAAA